MDNKKASPLPEEVIYFEVFTRLPVKSLYRFRSVSKFCRSLTSDPWFLDAFCHHSPRRYALSFTAAWDFRHIFSASTSKRLEHLPHGAVYTHYNTTMIINGLTCMARGTQIFIRHFGTNEELLLPRFFSVPSHDLHRIYFCYDPETNKYKVLRTTSVSAGHQFIGTKFSIFTLGADKSWRYFNQPGLYQLINSKNVCIDGVLLCNNYSTSKQFKDAAFVVGKECFDANISYPEGLSRSRHISCHLTNVKGSIAVIDVQDLGIFMIRLWVKVQGPGSESSWLEHWIQFPSPLENISRKESFNFSFSTNGNGEIVMGFQKLWTPGCQAFCHNMETGKWRRIDMVILEKHVVIGDFLVQEYVENPLLLHEVLKS